ncbi:MAG: hypothetical protein AAF633_16385 [Chloroflexota bacterium]
MTLKLKALPAERDQLDIDATIDHDAFAKMAAGFIPKSPADKWILLMDDKLTLYVHRIQSRTCIFQIRFEPTPDKAYMRIAEGWVNRNPQEYRSTKAGYDAKLLIYLIRSLLLNHDVPFPAPSNLSEPNQQDHEQHVMGQVKGVEKTQTSFIPINVLSLNPNDQTKE